MDEKQIKAAAFELAEKQPDHAGRSAYPPQSWRVEGAEIVVLCADGRKVRGPLPEEKPKAKAEKIMALPVHPPAKVPEPSGKPKAGK